MSGGGVLTLAAGGTLAIEGTGAKTLSGYTLNNMGTVVWTGGDLRMSSTSTVDNSGLWDVQGDLFMDYYGSPISTFNNSGVFRKSVGIGTATVEIIFNNSGSLEAQTGVVVLSGGGNDTGNFNVSQSAKLDMAGGTHLLDQGTSFSGEGPVRVSSGTVNAGDTADDSVSMINVELSGGTLGGVGILNVTGSMTWTGGTMSGGGVLTLAAGGTLAIEGAGAKTLSGYTLNNMGTVVWTGGDLRMSSTSTVDNSGLWDVQGDLFMDYYGSPISTFNNSGVFRKSVGTGTATVEIVFNNSGSLEVQTGVVKLTSGYTQTSSGGLTLEMGGLAVGSQFSAVNVTGTATLDGTLKLILTDGFVPVSGDLFQIMTFGSRSGTFATVDDNGVFNISYNATDVVATAP
jgi:adhesin HecA-like repeat protein